MNLSVQICIFILVSIDLEFTYFSARVLVLQHFTCKHLLSNFKTDGLVVNEKSISYFFFNLLIDSTPSTLGRLYQEI